MGRQINKWNSLYRSIKQEDDNYLKYQANSEQKTPSNVNKEIGT